ncbi:MAG: redoxin domain-containing protein [Candidatus Heimdallarchaeota archaeon]|nr:redoxin domain-containing protein [Candidatus Heimdallarchaeota archaeon]
MITVGDSFPTFSLQGALKDKINTYTQDTFKGKWTFLFSYPEDFSFVCPTEAKAFEEERVSIERDGGQIFGISSDDINTHVEWIKEIGINFPLLSDDGKFLKKLGVIDEDGKAKRATFIISPNLKVDFLMITTRNVGRSVKETIRVFEAIQTGRMCPVDFVGA